MLSAMNEQESTPPERRLYIMVLIDAIFKINNGDLDIGWLDRDIGINVCDNAGVNHAYIKRMFREGRVKDPRPPPGVCYVRYQTYAKMGAHYSYLSSLGVICASELTRCGKIAADRGDPQVQTTNRSPGNLLAEVD